MAVCMHARTRAHGRFLGNQPRGWQECSRLLLRSSPTAWPRFSHVVHRPRHVRSCAGKTLIARQIGKLLNAVEPKIVNGPEILDKYVGESEKKVRELFADAERDEAALAEESPLHVIIFDEIDAICKARGSTGGGTGVHDSG